jgi:hypothetical protein
VSTNKADIQQIQKYLNGELDAKAMHALEKQAQDDPFLMDALEGYQNIGTNQQFNFNEVEQRFIERTAQHKKQPVVLWRVLSVAASLIIALGISLLWYKHNSTKKQVLASYKAQTFEKKPEPVALPDDNQHVNGLIVDSTGHPLANVRVAIKGSKLYSRTDTNGKFSIASADKKGILNVAAAGFDAKQVKVTGKSLKVILNETPSELASVSVTAYVNDDNSPNRTQPTIGWKAFRDYLRRNATMDDGETGIVKLAFTIGTNGLIDGVRVINGKNALMNQKAIDLVLNGPEWKTMTEAKQMQLKIRFRKG